MKNQSIVSDAIGHFHGGIHPPENKTLSSKTKISTVDLPGELVIPLQQSTGKSASPNVKAGDSVYKGQLIASCTTPVCANIHAPADGVIRAIQPCYTAHPSGLFKQAIVIEPNRDKVQSVSDISGANGCKPIDKVQNETNINDSGSTKQWADKTTNELLSQIKNAGIVGLGGATFPTAVKLNAKSIESLIVNAMECEPYITCDDRMLQELSQQVIEGAQIAAKVLNAKEIIFATEDNKPEALISLKQAIEESRFDIDMRIVIAPTKYPSGGEKQIIELVLGKQVPHGSLPAALGVIVQNVATLHAIYRAVVYNKPLTERLITITGDLVKKPGNYWIAFGTKLNYLMDFFEIPLGQCKKAILGGPLMGQTINNFEAPVTKSTNCIIFNRENDEKGWVTEAKNHQACIRCGDCEKVCPAELLPQQLYWLSQSDQWEPVEKQGLFDCIECGACAYVCPSEIPLVHYFRYAKSTIRSNQLKQAKSDIAKKRFDFREMRIQRAKDERALKHQKAAEARRKAAENKEQDPTGKQTAINQALDRVKQKKATLTEKQNTGNNN